MTPSPRPSDRTHALLPTADVVVFAGGDAVPAATAAFLPADATVIAADAGLAIATALRCPVDLLVGDLDSVEPAALAAAEDDGVAVERHPVDKDRTDLAIALDVAMTLRPERITVVGGGGGRVDHLLGNALLLASPVYAGARIVAHLGHATITVVRDEAELTGTPGELVSLLPVHGTATGVTTTGLRFPLLDDELSAGSSRGVSNTFADPTAHVRLRAGVLLAVQPGDVHPPAPTGAPFRRGR